MCLPLSVSLSLCVSLSLSVCLSLTLCAVCRALVRAHGDRVPLSRANARPVAAVLRPAALSHYARRRARPGRGDERVLGGVQGDRVLRRRRAVPPPHHHSTYDISARRIGMQISMCTYITHICFGAGTSRPRSAQVAGPATSISSTVCRRPLPARCSTYRSASHSEWLKVDPCLIIGHFYYIMH